MKVGLYTISPTPTVGGAFVLRDDVARAAIESSGHHQFELVSYNKFPRLRRRFGRHLARLASIRHRFNSLRRQSLKQEASRRGLDMLWFNMVEPFDAGLPYMLTIFDLQHRLQPWFPEVSANGQWSERETTWSQAALRASIILVGSDEAKKDLSFFYGIPPKRIHVVPFPTPQPAIDAAASGNADNGTSVRKKYGIDGDYLFYPAQFWPHKNHFNLLQALRRLRAEKGMALSLVLTGSDHGNLNYIHDLVSSHHLEDCVHFLGFIPHEDVIALYRGARALSYVSFFGPENLPPLEAMALGCPVVLADIPGVRTLFGEAPILVDPRNPESIAAGVQRAVEDSALRQHCIALGRELAMSNTREQYVSRIHEILDQFEPFRRCWR
jgi:glycosyltransferase involved in cell wall biosynthesis